MNKFQLRFFLLALVFPLLLVSCGDDDDDDVSPNVSMLTAGEWTGDAIYFNDEDITAEVLEQDEFDVKEFTAIFERNGDFTESYNGTVVAEGQWEYENDERVLVFKETGGDEYSVVISKLDNDEFRYITSGYEFRFVR